MSTDPNLSALEGAFEFGGSVALSLAVVHGELSVMAGIYYRRARGATILEAYFRACGQVTVFGFVQISILIMIALSYRNEEGASSLYGQVTVRIRVKVGFFSKSFSFEYQKRFAGSGSGAGGGGGSALQRQRRRYLHIVAARERLRRAKTAPEELAQLVQLPSAAALSVPMEVEAMLRVRWRWGSAPWPAADEFHRPAFARPPRFCETMTPGDWGSSWRRFDWRHLRRTADGKPVPELQPGCAENDLHTPTPVFP